MGMALTRWQHVRPTVPAAAVALIVLLAGADVFAQKRAITHEDVWLAKRLGAPIVSPDGKWAAVQVTEPAYDERDQASDLWLVPVDGSAPPRRLTATRAGESGAAWDPDGRRIAFSARRETDEAAQLYVIDVAGGGEARRVTTLSTGARTPIWRPDGKALAFISDVYPGAGTDDDNRRIAAERRNRKWNARVFDSFPIRDWDRWLDDRRPSLFVQVLDAGDAFEGRPRRLEARRGSGLRGTVGIRQRHDLGGLDARRRQPRLRGHREPSRGRVHGRHTGALAGPGCRRRAAAADVGCGKLRASDVHAGWPHPPRGVPGG